MNIITSLILKFKFWRHAKHPNDILVLENYDFSDCSIDLHDQSLYKIKFVRCQFRGALFYTLNGYGRISHCEFNQCDFFDAAFGDDIRLAYCTFENCNFYAARFYTTNPFALCTVWECCGVHPVFPEQGAFIAYKKVAIGGGEYGIAELRVPEDALRVSGTSRKGRVSKAEVIRITKIGTGEEVTFGYSPMLTDSRRIFYRKGTTVIPDKFELNRWNTCSNGIHCFATKEEALAFKVPT